MTYRNKHTGAFMLALSAALLSSQALAIPVTVSGATVSFTYDSDLAGLFGAPTVVADSIFFNPTSFKAQSFNGAGFVSTSQTFNITVNAKPGYLVSAVNLTEDGDYYNIGSGTGVAVGGKLYVRDLGSPLSTPLSASIKPTAPLTDVTTLGGFETTNWTATAGVTVPSAVSGVNVTIQNILLANSSSLGSAAFIEKKFAGLSIVTAIPEPQTYALFLAGLGLVGFMAWRGSRLPA